MRRRPAFLALGAVVLAACGGGNDTVEPAAAGVDTTSASSATSATGNDATTDATNDAATDTTNDATTDAPATTNGTEPAPETAEASSEAPGSDTTAAPAPATTEAPATPIHDDGCSPDNSPTEPDVADGPLPTIEVRAASADNQLPDVAVRRINCAGGWVNIKNEVPNDKPVLIWMWAPH